MKFFKNSLQDLRGLHPYSRQIFWSSLQLAAALALFGWIMERAALHTPDILRTLQYADAAMENVPVMLAVGVVCALLSDLCLRRKTAENPSDRAGKVKKAKSKKTAAKQPKDPSSPSQPEPYQDK